MPFAHEFSYDPTYGYDLDALLRVAPPTDEPDDFQAFWQDTFDQARAIPPAVTLTEIASPDPRRGLSEIAFDAWGDRRIGGWLIQPIHETPRIGVVMGHGYGGRPSPLPLPDFQTPATILMLCQRGFHRSTSDDLPNAAARHVLHGIEHRDTYLHRGCATDLWAAASALLEIEPGIANQLTYWGSSFGGGIGAIALPWDQRFRRAFLDVPSFGHHPIRLQLPCAGSGRAVSAYHQRHPQVADVLRYYDAAFGARRITIPTMVAAACFDPCVPPPGQFAVFNALACERELFVRHYAHFELPAPLPDNNPWDASCRWLAQGLA